MKTNALRNGALATAFLAAILVARSYSEIRRVGSVELYDAAARPLSPGTTAANSWDPKAAAAYLDQREQWWMGWQEAAREHGTFCVSCHTAVPYALARPPLRKVLGEPAPTENERILLENVRKRVRIWKEIAPVYNDKEDGPNKSAESRATEAVLIAFVLAANDVESGKLSNDT